MTKNKILKEKIDFLIETNSTDKDIFVSFKQLFLSEPENIDYLMLYSRFLWRTCYGRWKDKKYLLISEKILYKVIDIINKKDINLKKLLFKEYEIYSWLAMIYWYLWDIWKSEIFFNKSENSVSNDLEKRQVLEWKSWVYIKEKRYIEIIKILSSLNLDIIRYRSIWYLFISYYETWDYENFKKLSELYLKKYLSDRKKDSYIFLVLNDKSYWLSTINLENTDEIKSRSDNLRKNLSCIIDDWLSFQNLINKLRKYINNWATIYWFEWTQKYIKIYLNNYYE